MHLTDDQLNEYLDHETNDRVRIEWHLAACEECSARLTALRDLFAEIESLSELQLSPEFSRRFTPNPSTTLELPPSLTLTVTVQAMLTVVAIMIAAPFVMSLISWNTLSLSVPSLMDVFLQLQSQWAVWLDMLSTISFPTMPEIPIGNVSSLFTVLTVIGVSLLWLVGNGLLLRNQMK